MVVGRMSKKVEKTPVKPKADKTEFYREALNKLVDRPRLEARSISELATLMADVMPEAQKLMNKLNGSEKKADLIRIGFSQMTLSACRLNEEKYNRPIDKTIDPCGLRIRGEVFFVFKRDPGFFSNYSRLFPFINTGCGGGSSRKDGYVNNYEVTLCLDDFPLMKADYMAQQAMKADLEAREKRVSDRAAEIHKSDFEYIAVCENLEKARKTFDKAQADKLVALRAAEILLNKSEEKAKSEIPFDFDALEKLGDFLK